jgi:hypothetical protein
MFSSGPIGPILGSHRPWVNRQARGGFGARGRVRLWTLGVQELEAGGHHEGVESPPIVVLSVVALALGWWLGPQQASLTEPWRRAVGTGSCCTLSSSPVPGGELYRRSNTQ